MDPPLSILMLTPPYPTVLFLLLYYSVFKFWFAFLCICISWLLHSLFHCCSVFIIAHWSLLIRDALQVLSAHSNTSLLRWPSLSFSFRSSQFLVWQVSFQVKPRHFCVLFETGSPVSPHRLQSRSTGPDFFSFPRSGGEGQQGCPAPSLPRYRSVEADTRAQVAH